MAYAVDSPIVGQTWWRKSPTKLGQINVITANATNATPWIKNVRSDDISGTEEILAAGGGGISHYITKLFINSTDAITITIGAGETGPGSVAAVIMGPISFAAKQTLIWTFEFPIKVAADTSITCDASAGGVVNIFVEGFTL